MELRCGSCHGATGSLQGLNLTSYQAVLQGGSSGPAISPGDPDNSLLILKQTGEQNHFGQLSADELDMVSQWIAAGAPEK